MNWINKETADKIKEILKYAELNEVVQVKSSNGLLESRFDKVSQLYIYDKYYEKTGLVMYNRELFVQDSNKVLDIELAKSTNLFFGVGEWRNKGSYRIDDVHIILGSKSSKLNEYFAQLDLSESIEDENYIYILKNITKNAGSGSCQRLYKGKSSLSNDQKKKMLLETLNSKTYIMDNYKWLVVSKINKKELKDKKRHGKILSDILRDFITYAFAIEEIRNIIK